MTNHDPPLQRQGAGTLDDEFQAKCSEVARFVQVDVDRFSMTICKGEDGIEMTHRIEQATGAMLQDFGYALLRAKLLSQMVIDVAAATELLHQAGADPRRLDLAEAFVLRRFHDTELSARRIESNAEGRIERDARVLELA